MANSRYEHTSYEYEVIDINPDILAKLNQKLEERADLIATANESEITLFHLAWIKSFQPIIEEIDPKGEIDSWSSEHSESLVKSWNFAQYGGNYSSHEKETLKLSPNYLDAKIFNSYLSVLLSLQSGKAKIVTSKVTVPKEEAKIDDGILSGGKKKKDRKSDVFIVHGHDELAQVKVARFLGKLGLNPVILHEQANAGKTIIEKIDNIQIPDMQSSFILHAI